MKFMNYTNEFSFILKPSQYGVGVFATHDIEKGTRLRLFGDDNPVRLLKKEDVPKAVRYLCASRGDILLCPSDFGCMQIGWHLNHSDNSNAVHDKNEPAENYYGIWHAQRDIKEGEEITINYNVLEEPEEDKGDFQK
jgi:hypothetical protein